MTAVPKPLKFLRPHYDELTELYEKWPAGTVKVCSISDLQRYKPQQIHDLTLVFFW